MGLFHCRDRRSVVLDLRRLPSRDFVYVDCQQDGPPSSWADQLAWRDPVAAAQRDNFSGVLGLDVPLDTSRPGSRLGLMHNL